LQFAQGALRSASWRNQSKVRPHSKGGLPYRTSAKLPSNRCLAKIIGRTARLRPAPRCANPAMFSKRSLPYKGSDFRHPDSVYQAFSNRHAFVFQAPLFWPALWQVYSSPRPSADVANRQRRYRLNSGSEIESRSHRPRPPHLGIASDHTPSRNANASRYSSTDPTRAISQNGHRSPRRFGPRSNRVAQDFRSCRDPGANYSKTGASDRPACVIVHCAAHLLNHDHLAAPGAGLRKLRRADLLRALLPKRPQALRSSRPILPPIAPAHTGDPWAHCAGTVGWRFRRARAWAGSGGPLATRLL